MPLWAWHAGNRAFFHAPQRQKWAQLSKGVADAVWRGLAMRLGMVYVCVNMSRM